MKKAIFVLLVIFMFMQSAHAYTDVSGVETGDTVNVAYVLHLDNETGTIKDQNQNFQTIVDAQHVIQGFYEGLLGMKISTTKWIIVPPNKGYQTGALAGHTLYFYTTLNFIVKNIHTAPITSVAPPSSTPSTSSSSPVGSVLGSFFNSTPVKFFGGVIILFFIYIKLSAAKAPIDPKV